MKTLKEFMLTDEFKEDCEKAELFYTHGYNLMKEPIDSYKPYYKKVTLISAKVAKHYFSTLFHKIETTYVEMVNALDTANNGKDWEVFAHFSNNTGVGKLYGTGATGYAHSYTREKLARHITGEHGFKKRDTIKLLDLIEERLEECKQSDFLVAKRLGELQSTLLNHINSLSSAFAVYDEIDIPEFRNDLPDWRARLQNYEHQLFELYESRGEVILKKFRHPNDMWNADKLEGDALRSRITELYDLRNERLGSIILGLTELDKNIKYITEDTRPANLSATSFYVLVEDNEESLTYNLCWYEEDVISGNEEVYVEHTFRLPKPAVLKEEEDNSKPDQLEREKERSAEIAKAQADALAMAKKMQEEAMAAAQKSVEEAQKEAQRMMEQMKKNPDHK